MDAPDAPDADDLLAQVPARDEIAREYPNAYTWLQLRQFVDSGDLGLLKRHPALQTRYDAWCDRVRALHGDLPTYLVRVRLAWAHLPPPPLGLFFSPHTPADLWKVLPNDWPYSVPPEIEHSLVWSRVPITDPALIPAHLRARIDVCGLWGFTGGADADLLADQSYLADGARFTGTGDEAAEVRAAIAAAGAPVAAFVRARWPEDAWETAWFVNPPRLQSIPGLAHAHVFAKPKNARPST
ncbi:hypothetical protein AURDEDRAFT_111680 [Auricularia subglabra TFB-10046 SS5]|nr:hypothetical protein AURDEDRAFT_111680 [Auricularia subglabra TFB-10046 SS5]